MITFSDLGLPDRLWELIDRARGTEAGMKEVLAQLPAEDLILFEYYFDCATADLRSRAQAARVEFPSEDTTLMVAGWVVSQGREYYQKVFDDIERLFPLLSEDELGVSYFGMAGSVYEDRYHEAIPERFDCRWE